jgi:P27 family predicted phage terminase small subunit
MRGRKPTPVEQRIAEGNPGKRPLPEPVVLERVREGDDHPLLTPPDHLPKAAKEAWLQTVPTLAKVGLLDSVDVLALEAMCIQYARARQAGVIIAAQGPVTRGSTGQLREHPSIATERNAHAMFLRFAEQYALTPSARTRLGLAELQRRQATEELADRLGESNVGAGR